MENLTILIFLIAGLFFITGFLIRSQIITYKVKNISELSSKINEVAQREMLHPLTLLIYDSFIQDFHSLELRQHTIVYNSSNLQVSFWISNTVYDRKYYDICDNAKNVYGEREHINSQLTLADKIVLEEISRRITAINKEFIDKAFIKNYLITKNV